MKTKNQKKEMKKTITELDEGVVADSNGHEGCEQRLAEMEMKYKRALADYQNLMRQSAQERQEYVKYANQNLVEELLPILDSLEMAAKHLEDQGLVMVVNQFHQFLDQKGLSTIAPAKGEPFDEHRFECIETVSLDDGSEDGTVARLLTKGYAWQDGTVVRHAKVTVFSNKE